MDSAAPDEMFYTAPLRRLRRAVWPVMLCIAFAVGATSDGETRLLRGALIALAMLCGLLAAVRLWPVFRRPRPALTLTPDGFLAPADAADLVPWSAVAHLTPVIAKRAARLTVWLNGGAEASFAPSRVRAIRLRLGLSRRSRLSLDLTGLAAEPWAIVDRFEARVRDTPTIAQTQDVGSPPRPARVAYPATAEEGAPFLSIGFVVLMTAILAIEIRFALGAGAGISAATLWALGGSSRTAIIGDGQWWRLVTASLLHLGILHFAFNAFALIYAGRLFERLVGWRWFAGCFALSAVAGSLASIWWNAPNAVGVGASGGILGLFAAMGVLAFRFSPGDGHHERLLVGSVLLLLPSIVPFLFLAQRGNQAVDVAAHIGGALAGALVGAVLLRA